MMKQIVINYEPGGFSLSDEAREWLRCRTPAGWPHAGRPLPDDAYARAFPNSRPIPRDDPYLVSCVLALGDKANGRYAALKTVEIPNDVEWEIEVGESGAEWVAEKHRKWE